MQWWAMVESKIILIWGFTEFDLGIADMGRAVPVRLSEKKIKGKKLLFLLIVKSRGVNSG